MSNFIPDGLRQTVETMQVELLSVENWRHIIGYKGLYEVSNRGRIRNTTSQSIIKPTNDGEGYMKVMLYKNGTRRNLRVHILVAKAWIRNRKGKREVNHKNKIRHDNYVDNLEWVTRSENMIHCYKHKHK